MSFTIEKIEISSAKSLAFDIKLLGRSFFIYFKSNNGPKIDHCGMPALISSKWEFLPLMLILISIQKTLKKC